MKFEMNPIKIKGSYQSRIKVVTHNSKSDLPLSTYVLPKPRRNPSAILELQLLNTQAESTPSKKIFSLVLSSVMITSVCPDPNL